MKPHMNTVLVTGINGFIGAQIASHFVQRGSYVAGIDRPADSSAVCSEYLSLTLPSIDLAPRIRSWGPSLCIHCAGPSSVGNSMLDPAADFAGSAVATYSLLDAIRREAPACRFLYLSSAAVYGNPLTLPIGEDAPVQPISPDGFHQHMCELLCLEFHRAFALSTVAVRIFSAYGPGLRRQVVADICAKLAGPGSGPIMLHGTGCESRDFIHVADIVGGIQAVVDHAPFEAEVYNLATGVSISIAALAEMLRGFVSPVREISFLGDQRSGDPLHWSANIEKLRALGFRPSKSIESGLNEYAKWFKETVEAPLP